VPFLSALDVVYDDALYKSTFTLLTLLYQLMTLAAALLCMASLTTDILVACNVFTELRRGLAVTALVKSTTLLYLEPG